MLVTYVLKPDMLNNQEAVDYFFTELTIRGIKIMEIYYINDWHNLSKELYFPNNKIAETADDIGKLLTIRGYIDLFLDNRALVIELDVNYSLETARQLSMLKKEIRQKYCYAEEKVYTKIINAHEVNLYLPIHELKIERIKNHYVRVKRIEDAPDGYSLLYFNYIHFPDPYVKELSTDAEIIKSLKFKANFERVYGQ